MEDISVVRKWDWGREYILTTGPGGDLDGKVRPSVSTFPGVPESR